ncbi:hypothetical protein [Sunxiuqinia rutila]|uniref:hypothetical protein n=1 Tax=Sunxiuqinia rutila TaxID=1397841 RepID=UPI003D362C44
MRYLETNSLRRFASQLTEESFISDKYTSILSLLEIISGISDDESFKLRKSIIKKIIRSQIKTDLTLPELKIYNAFGIDYNNSEILEKIMMIIRIIDTVKDYNNMESTIKLNYLFDVWEFVKQYDKNANIEFRKVIFNRFPDSGIKKLIQQFNERWTQENLNLLKTKIVDFYAGIIFRNLPNQSRKSKSEIYSAYDNSIDIYLIVTAFYIDEKISFKNIPGKNDYLDLNHLIYLYKYQNQIITDDKLLFKLLTKIYPNNILKTNRI